jgi:alginate O-acetyltransferase complex protein AlgI
MAFLPDHILILLFLILIDYVIAIPMEHVNGRWKVILLGIGLTSNIGILVSFKYINFLIENIRAISVVFDLGLNLSNSRVILPLGLSFFTFQSLSYLLEVYWGRQKAERHVGYLAVYILYFPQLVAGPIERPQNMPSSNGFCGTHKTPDKTLK